MQTNANEFVYLQGSDRGLPFAAIDGTCGKEVLSELLVFLISALKLYNLLAFRMKEGTSYDQGRINCTSS